MKSITDDILADTKRVIDWIDSIVEADRTETYSALIDGLASYRASKSGYSDDPGYYAGFFMGMATQRLIYERVDERKKRLKAEGSCSKP